MEFVYFQAVTITARVVGKVVPADQFARLATRGVMQHRTAVANLQTTREGELLGGGVGAAEYCAVPDLDTFCVLPWDHKVAGSSAASTSPTTCSPTPALRSPATPAV